MNRKRIVHLDLNCKRLILSFLSCALFGAVDTSDAQTVDPCLVPPSEGYSLVRFTMGGTLSLTIPRYSILPGAKITIKADELIVYDEGFPTTSSKTVVVRGVMPGESILFSARITLGPGDVVDGTNPTVSAAYGTMGLNSGTAAIFFWFQKTWMGDQWLGFGLTLSPDLSTARDLRPSHGPPREDCPLVSPAEGELHGYFDHFGFAGDSLTVFTKTDSLFVPPALYKSALNFGVVHVGDSIHTPLTSNAPETRGERMYPRHEFNPWSWTAPMWYAEYEDWIDCNFFDAVGYYWIAPSRYSISFDKSSFAPGDTLRMSIDASGFVEDPYEPMNINILIGRDDAQIVNENGTVYGADLSGISYQRIARGLRLVVKRLAVSPRIVVQAFDAWDWLKSGRAEVTGTNKHLKILEHQPWEIWPDLKSSAKGLSGYKPKRSFVIQVLDGSGQPVKDEHVSVRTDFVALSGGHNHNTPPLSRSKQGQFFGQARHGNPLTTLKTDTEGKITLDSLVASEIAGKYVVTAYLAADTAVRDTVNLQVEVPNLLAFSGAGNYSLTGSLHAHSQNHFLSSQAGIDSLISAANEFARAKWNTTGNMKLNDMSLEWGGLFDTDSDWTKPHALHRIGKSVDIENLLLETIDTVDQKTGKAIKLTVPKVKWLKDFVNLMDQAMGNWNFEDEGQLRLDLLKRTRKYPHFEWKGN